MRIADYHIMSNFCKNISETIAFCEKMLYIKSPPKKVLEKIKKC